MPSKTNCTRTALLLTSAMLALSGATSAMAQDAAGEDKPVETIVVTGSRIRVEAPVGSAITSLGSADIAESGRVTLDRAIKELPQVFDLGVSENSRGQSGGAGNIVLATRSTCAALAPMPR